MKPWLRPTLLLICLLMLLGLPFQALPNGTPAVVKSQAPRLVIFEGFYKHTWGECRTAGLVVDQMANEYNAQSKPVIFLEWDVLKENDPAQRLTDRLETRFGAANDTSPNELPLLMVDSGHTWYKGLPDGSDTNVFKAYYKTHLVDPELARAPQAEVSASMWRVGDHMRFQARVKNLSGGPLSAANYASVTVIVYEDVVRTENVYDTSRMIRAAKAYPLTTALADNATATYTLDTNDMTGVDWDKLHGVAFVDYRPVIPGPYDMLQAAVAGAPYFSVDKNNVPFAVDLVNPGAYHSVVTTSGYPADLTWSATKDSSNWFSITPTSGQVGAQLSIDVNPNQFNHTAGTYTGQVHLSAVSPSGTLTQDITVRAVVTGPSFTVSKNEVFFLVDAVNPGAPQSTISTGGYPTSMNWSATLTGGDWLSVNPATAQVGAPLTILLDPSKFPGLGDYLGTLHLTANGPFGPLTQDITVNVKVVSSIEYFFLPIVNR